MSVEFEFRTDADAEWVGHALADADLARRPGMAVWRERYQVASDSEGCMRLIYPVEVA